MQHDHDAPARFKLPARRRPGVLYYEYELTGERTASGLDVAQLARTVPRRFPGLA